MITDQHRRQVAAEREQTRAIATEVAELQLQTSDDLTFASTTLREIKGQRERLERQLKAIVDPSKRAAAETEQAAKALFRDALEDLALAERVLRQQIAAYHDALLVERRRAITAAAATATIVEAAAPPPKVEGVTKRTLWRWRVTDAAAVPRDYLMLDEAKIGAMVRASKGETNIPGIEAYSETILNVSGS